MSEEKEITFYKIEKNIPYNRMVGMKYPFLEMEIGDSILFPKDFSGQRINNYFSRLKYLCPEKKFSVRKVENGRRVWRIK